MMAYPSPKLRAAFAGILCSFLITPNPAYATESSSPSPDISWHGLLDLRLQYLDSQPGEIGQGLGKFRFGGTGGRLRANAAALVVQTRLGWDWSGSLTIKYADRQYNPIDLSEAFLSYKPVSTTAWQLGVRLGMFFPPISMENTGTAWTSPYTLNSSAINTWVGEELKVFGGEAHLSYQTGSGERIKLFAAGLANNDTAGVLLAWRGWSLQDYQATLNDRLRLPEHIGIQNNFPKQATLSQPFVEVDGRPGYYTGLTIERANHYAIRALYYDNRGQPAAIQNGQYAWHTQFWSLGFKADLPWDLSLISQGINGRTQMGESMNGRFAVNTRFWAASVMLSKVFDQHRFSLRYERFGTAGKDYLPQDPNQENGQAWTANYNLTLAQRHQINFEASHINSNRQARLNLNQQTSQGETIWQIAYRLFF